jgi:hypothetical protein
MEDAMKNEQKADIFKSGFDAGYSRSTDLIANPFNSNPNSDAYDLWHDGYIAGDKQRQILTDK